MAIMNPIFEKLFLRKRSHLFEFDDQPWLPKLLRRAYMEILGNNIFRTSPFKDRLRKDLESQNVEVIHSLCSGDGQFIYFLYKLLEKDRKTKFVLSDLFPLPQDYLRLKTLTHGDIDFIATPIDATQIQPVCGDWFLMAGSLHHLQEEQVKAIFERITENDRTLIMMENHDRSYAQALKLLIILPVFSILASIFGKPFRLEKLLFGALLPIVPLMILVDGLVSNFRSYRLVDLQQILDQLPNVHDYSIKAFPIRYAVILTGVYFVLSRQPL